MRFMVPSNIVTELTIPVEAGGIWERVPFSACMCNALCLMAQVLIVH